jgi:hypothetical protein
MRKIVLFTFVFAVALLAFGNATSAQDSQTSTSKDAKKMEAKAAKDAKKQEEKAMKDAKKQEKQATKDAKMDAKSDAKMAKSDAKMMDHHMMMATLTGAAEVPGPGDTDGSGTASITLNHDKGEVCWDVMVKDIAKPTAAHIHVGAAGTSGGVKVPLKADADGTWKGCSMVDKAVIKEIMDNPANYYVNVHNEEFKAGAVRGQLGKQ